MKSLQRALLPPSPPETPGRELPPGWIRARLGDVATSLDARRAPVSCAERELRLAGSTARYPYYGATGPIGEIDEYRFEGEAVLVGDCLRVADASRGKAYVVDGRYWVSNHAHVLRARPPLGNRFLCHQLNAIDRELVQGHGPARPGKPAIDALEVVVAPEAEQQRIVERIDALFARIDEGERALARARELAGMLERSVVKAAAAGDLTRDWRARRGSDPAHAARAPAGWAQVGIEVLAARGRNAIRRGPFGTRLSKADFTSSGYKVYGQQHAITGDFDAGTYFIPRAKFDELRAFHVHPGDLIVSCSGTVGRVAIVPPDAAPGVIGPALLKLTVDRAIVLPQFLGLVFAHCLGTSSRRGAGMANLAGVDELKKIAFPLPPLAEQAEVVRRAAQYGEAVRRCVESLDRELARPAELRRAVLRAAFTGRLVHGASPGSSVAP